VQYSYRFVDTLREANVTEDIRGAETHPQISAEPDFLAGGLRWFVVNTHPAAEQKACMHLENQGWQTFFPRIARSLRSGRRIRTELRPLFPGYVFVRFNIAYTPWRAIDSTVGVRRLVKHGETPAAVPYGVVEAIQDMTQPNGQVVFTTDLKPGDKIKFLTGPFAEMVGTLERMDSKGRVLVLLELLGRAAHVVAHGAELQPVR
jgi:transcriptional antiterminator RfaH